MADEEIYSEGEIDLDEINEAGDGGQPAPVGTWLCRISCEGPQPLGQNRGYKVKGTVLEENCRGRTVEDLLFLSDKAIGRIKLALHRLAGIEGGKITREGIKEALDGAIGRMTVSEIYYNLKNDTSRKEYTLAQSEEYKQNVDPKAIFYGHTRVPFAGYDYATSEEIQKYGGVKPTPVNTPTPSSNGTQAGVAVPSGKLPF